MSQILFLSHYFHPRIGGVEKHALKVCLDLVQRGHSVNVITSQHEPSLPLHETYRGIEIIRLQLPAGSWQKPPKFHLWRQLFHHRHHLQQADIIHCHDVFFWYLPFKYFWPLKPVYTTFHGFEGVFPPNAKSKLMRKLSENLSHGNICVGSFIEKWYGTKADFITYGGTDTFKSTLPPKALKLLYLGRLDKDTGIESFLDAIPSLQKEFPQLTVEFCGDGPFKDTATQYGIVHGFQSDISKFINNSRYIFTSGYLSMLESLAHRRSVFSTYTNQLKQDYLYMSPFKDKINIYTSPHDLVSQIRLMSQNQILTQTKLQSNIQWAKTQTWSQVTDTYLQLWRLG